MPGAPTNECRQGSNYAHGGPAGAMRGARRAVGSTVGGLDPEQDVVYQPGRAVPAGGCGDPRLEGKRARTLRFS